MKKKLMFLALATALAIPMACKQEEPYDFGSSSAQATGTVRAPDQPENANAPLTAAPTPAAPASLSATDSQFVTRAALGGLAEVELSRLAQQKATAAEVKQFGQMMVDDHTKANQEFGSIVAGKGVTLPTTLDPEHKAIRDRLNTLSGSAFDREYMSAMVKDHNDAVAAFQNEAGSGSDPDLKGFASKTLPTLQAHQTRAKAIAGKLK